MNYSKVECLESDVKFIAEHCHLPAGDSVLRERNTFGGQENTTEASDTADDELQCEEQGSKQVSRLIKGTEKNEENSYFDSKASHTSSVRALLNQLSQEEMDRLYSIYKHDFDILEYRPL